MKREELDDTTERSPQSDSISEAEIIAFSANLVSCLEDKRQSFNEENKSALKINQLKEVYRRGASGQQEDLNLHGLARVNMILRQQTNANESVEKENSSLVAEELVFEESEASVDMEFDISEDWQPSEEDYKSAKKDAEKFDLKLNFSSIDELYIEPYKPIDFYWE